MLQTCGSFRVALYRNEPLLKVWVELQRMEKWMGQTREERDYIGYHVSTNLEKASKTMGVAWFEYIYCDSGFGNSLKRVGSTGPFTIGHHVTVASAEPCSEKEVVVTMSRSLRDMAKRVEKSLEAVPVILKHKFDDDNFREPVETAAALAELSYDELESMMNSVKSICRTSSYT